MDPQELHNMLGALVSNCPELEEVCQELKKDKKTF